MKREVVVKVDTLVKDFPPNFGFKAKRVLHGVSFEVYRGEIFGFVGPNGAGKTTTLKTLMGLIRPTEGRAEILGHDVRETDFRRHVGFLPEAPYFYDYLSGREFLRFYAKVCGVAASTRAARIDELLDWVGLSHAGEARLRTFSKGMLQRIGIAQALVHDPDVVFLDEPMSGLDPIGRKEIRDLIRRLQAEGKTVFMNTHILSDVEMLCDRVAIIVKGRIRFEGRSDEVSAGDGDVELVMTQVSPQLAQSFAARPAAEVRGQSDRIELRVPAKAANEVLREALDAGAEMISLTPRRPSLESVFLAAVEEGEEE